jgi:hypothetical protein
MLAFRALKFLYTVSCRRFAPGDVFVASAADVVYLTGGLVEPLTTEAQTALGQVPAPKESIGWAYPGKGGSGGKGGGGAFMWNAHPKP